MVAMGNNMIQNLNSPSHATTHQSQPSNPNQSNNNNNNNNNNNKVNLSKVVNTSFKKVKELGLSAPVDYAAVLKLELNAGHPLLRNHRQDRKLAANALDRHEMVMSLLTNKENGFGITPPLIPATINTATNEMIAKSSINAVAVHSVLVGEAEKFRATLAKWDKGESPVEPKDVFFASSSLLQHSTDASMSCPAADWNNLLVKPTAINDFEATSVISIINNKITIKLVCNNKVVAVIVQAAVLRWYAALMMVKQQDNPHIKSALNIVTSTAQLYQRILSQQKKTVEMTKDEKDGFKQVSRKKQQSVAQLWGEIVKENAEITKTLKLYESTNSESVPICGNFINSFLVCNTQIETMSERFIGLKLRQFDGKIDTATVTRLNDDLLIDELMNDAQLNDKSNVHLHYDWTWTPENRQINIILPESKATKLISFVTEHSICQIFGSAKTEKGDFVTVNLVKGWVEASKHTAALASSTNNDNTHAIVDMVDGDDSVSQSINSPPRVPSYVDILRQGVNKKLIGRLSRESSTKPARRPNTAQAIALSPVQQTTRQPAVAPVDTNPSHAPSTAPTDQSTDRPVLQNHRPKKKRALSDDENESITELKQQMKLMSTSFNAMIEQLKVERTRDQLKIAELERQLAAKPLRDDSSNNADSAQSTTRASMNDDTDANGGQITHTTLIQHMDRRLNEYAKHNEQQQQIQLTNMFADFRVQLTQQFQTYLSGVGNSGAPNQPVHSQAPMAMNAS